jgi:uncharacterized membrane protein
MRRRPFLLYSAAVVAAMLVVSGWAWLQLPAGGEIPIHWGVDGTANGFAPKELGLLLVPGLAILITGLFAAIPSLEPRLANLQQSRVAYGLIWSAAITLIGALHAVSVAVALGATLDVGQAVIAGIGLMWVLIGFALPRTRSNYLMGIRTPWTLTSERSWTATHRLGGRLFMALGVVLVVMALAGMAAQAPLAIMLGGMLAIIVALFAYSYVVWKGDPDRATTPR